MLSDAFAPQSNRRWCEQQVLILTSSQHRINTQLHTQPTVGWQYTGLFIFFISLHHAALNNVTTKIHPRACWKHCSHKRPQITYDYKRKLQQSCTNSITVCNGVLLCGEGNPAVQTRSIAVHIQKRFVPVCVRERGRERAEITAFEIFLYKISCCGSSEKILNSQWTNPLGPVHTGRGAPCNTCMQIMEHTAVNGSVHTGCKQHLLTRPVWMGA